MKKTPELDANGKRKFGMRDRVLMLQAISAAI